MAAGISTLAMMAMAIKKRQTIAMIPTTLPVVDTIINEIH